MSLTPHLSQILYNLYSQADILPVIFMALQQRPWSHDLKGRLALVAQTSLSLISSGLNFVRLPHSQDPWKYPQMPYPKMPKTGRFLSGRFCQISIRILDSAFILYMQKFDDKQPILHLLQLLFAWKLSRPVRPSYWYPNSFQSSEDILRPFFVISGVCLRVHKRADGRMVICNHNLNK